MGFEIKDAADFEKWAKDQNDRFETIKDLPSQVGDLASQMKEVKDVVQQLNARPIVAPTGKKIDAPFNRSEFAKAGLNAVLKSPTGVRRTGPGTYEPGEDEFGKFQDACDKALLFATAKRWIRGDGDMLTPAQMQRMPFYHDEYLPALKAVNAATKAIEGLDTSTAGEGLEWVPTEYSRRLWEKVRLEYRVASLFEEIVIPRSPFVLPTFVGDVTAYRHGEKTAGGSPGPGSVRNREDSGHGVSSRNPAGRYHPARCYSDTPRAQE